MCSFVNLQIFRPGEYFSTSRERAREWFFACVDTDVVDEFVLGLKRFPFSRTVLPVADVVGLLGAADVIHGHMGDHFVHGAESPVTSLFGSVHLVLIYPFAGQFLFDGLPHVSKEGPRAVVCRHIHSHVHVDRMAVVVELCPVGVCPGACDRAIWIRSSENIPA